MNCHNYKTCYSIFLTAFLALFPIYATAQDSSTTKDNLQGKPIEIGTEFIFNSEVLNEDRRLLISLPRNYDQQSIRYPVLYVLDGESQFEHVATMIDFLGRKLQIPPMIVVGITNTQRSRDFTPTSLESYSFPNPITITDTVSIPVRHSGGADQFIEFLTTELLPKINSAYRTADFQVLAGHSLSGLFSVYTFLTQPEAFNAIIAVGPSLWWDDEMVLRQAADSLPDFSSSPQFLHLTVGDREGRSILAPLSNFAKILEVKNPEGLHWWYRSMPGEAHNALTHKAIYEAVTEIFSEYAIPENLLWFGDYQYFKQRFTHASEFYGYQIVPPQGFLSFIGTHRLNELNKPEEAIKFLTWNTEVHQNSPSAYARLATVLKQVGRYEEAVNNLKIAIKKAEETDHEQLGKYREMLDEMKKSSEPQN